MVLKVSDLESSPEMIGDMMATRPWLDIIRLMEDRIDYLREQLDEESDILEIRMIQGEIKAMKNFIQGPDTLISHLLIDRQMATKEEKDNGRRN